MPLSSTKARGFLLFDANFKYNTSVITLHLSLQILQIIVSWRTNLKNKCGLYLNMQINLIYDQLMFL